MAASQLVSGDSLIKQALALGRSPAQPDDERARRSGWASLGQVPNAKIAANAQSLGRHPASAYELGSTGDRRSGLVTAAGGQTVKMASFGPFTVSLVCNDDGGGTFDAAIYGHLEHLEQRGVRRPS